MWMSESRAKRCGSVETSSARSQDGERRAAVAAREPLRKLRRETGFNVIGISLWAFQIANRKLQIINSLSPSFKRYSDFRQQFKSSGFPPMWAPIQGTAAYSSMMFSHI